MAILPELTHWVVWPIVGVFLVLILGFTEKLIPGVVQFQLGIDQWLDLHQNPVLTAVALTINSLFSPVGIVTILVLTFLYLLLVGRSPVNGFAFTSMVTVGWLSAEAFKLIVQMPRPDGLLLAHPVFAETGGDSSFPSGHTTFVAAFLIASYLFARQTRAKSWVAAVGAILLAVVAWSRLYGGAHYLLDVLGAVLVALTVIAFYVGMWNRYGMRVLNWFPFLRRIGPVPTWARGTERPGA